MSDALRLWIEQGEDCIRLLLEGGVANPGDIAKTALGAWIRGCADAGWLEMADLGKILLDEHQADDAKAAALLQLCVWFESVRSEFEQMSVLENYS